MKTILTLSNSAIVLTALLFLFGCKKERNPGKEEIKTQKIKSIIPRHPFRQLSNANFTYAEDGMLRHVDLNTSFMEHDRLDYTYPNGQTKIVAYDAEASVEPWAQRADIEFIYSGEKLVSINVISKHGTVPNVNYVFSYTGGLSPSAYTVTISDEKMQAPDVKTYQLTIDTKGNITGADSDGYLTNLEYDIQPNPLYKLPWMDVDRRLINYANHSASGIVFVMDVERFFSPNNIKKTTRFYDEKNQTSEETSYTYTEAGQPKKASMVITGQFPGSGGTEYLYW